MVDPKPLQAGGSLSDILTTAKNLVQAVNGLAQNYLNVQGLTNLAAIAATTVVKSTAGRICRISVTTAGSSTGLVYDGGSTNATSRPVYVIPEAVGIYDVNIPVTFGILVVVGTSQVLTVTYS